ncbi:MAG: cytochrome P450 [Actinobacteria bacterium]|nr:cytochrome P450 [Actinomycetota bacterium]
MRAEAPVCSVPSVGLWFVTRWRDVVAAAEDPARFPASMPGSPLDRTLGGASVLTVDGPEHAALRAPMEPILRPRAVEGHAPTAIAEIASDLLGSLEDGGEAELMSALCEPLSVLSLARVIGLPEHLDAPTLRRWFHELATGTSNYEGDAAKQTVADAASAEVDVVLRPRLEELMDRPDGSMLSWMLHASDGDLDARMRRMLPSLKLALIGGLQEPGHGMGSTIYGLLSNPDQLAAFLADPAGRIKRAVDEGLRWISPIGTQGRVAGADVEIAGVSIPASAPVGLIVPSANRDEEVFGPTADRFDMLRPRHVHTALGFGPHFCVGHYLARAQMRIAIRLLFERLPNLRLDPDRPARFAGWEYRGPAHLHVRWDR